MDTQNSIKTNPSTQNQPVALPVVPPTPKLESSKTNHMRLAVLTALFILMSGAVGFVGVRRPDLLNANLLIRGTRMVPSNVNLNLQRMPNELQKGINVTDSCAGVVCSQGAVCRDGRCVDTRCEGVVCAVNAYCDQGACRPNPVCGNSLVEKDEACDDGNTVAETECAYRTTTCQACSADCKVVLNLKGGFCGDKLVQSASGEQCDDGNTVSTDDCTNVCQSAKCGDGLVWAGHETCDEGSVNGTKAHCNSTCSGIKK